MDEQLIDDVSHKRQRGERMVRSEARDADRDAVMKMIFKQAGFAAKVARYLGVSHQNVSGWNRVPPHHVLKLSVLLDMKPEEIRPDVFGENRRRR